MELHSKQVGLMSIGRVLVVIMLLAEVCLSATNQVRQVSLAQAAAGLEREGKNAEAIAVYEQLAKQDPLAVKLVAKRLALLYAKNGNAGGALIWAKKVAKDHPDPEAYLASIHSLCGNHTEAARILTKALEANSLPRFREITLRWQLADVLIAQQKTSDAEQQLRKAFTLSEGHPEEPTAKKRLDRLAGKPEAPVFD
jgi:tetratricopeptide (TPR) repeat protein